jgi:triosephosphate isomerase (TIM)
MTQPLIVANWKSNLTTPQVRAWLTAFQQVALDELAVQPVLAPSFLHLRLAKEALPEIPLCAQTLSHFPLGAYTGAVSAEVAKEFVTYALLGHSERQKYFGETDAIVAGQVRQALDNDITPIVAVDEHELAAQLGQFVGEELTSMYVMYEPPEAISTSGSGWELSGQHLTEIATHAELLTTTYQVKGVLYGGSVDEDNVAEILAIPNISGVVVGSASLEEAQFREILKRAVK